MSIEWQIRQRLILAMDDIQRLSKDSGYTEPSRIECLTAIEDQIDVMRWSNNETILETNAVLENDGF